LVLLAKLRFVKMSPLGNMEPTASNVSLPSISFAFVFLQRAWEKTTNHQTKHDRVIIN
jgi:hypothetical protein